MKKRIISVALMAVLAMGLMVGCGSNKAEEDKTLVMATNATFPPYEYMEGDQYQGIDIEIAQAIAEELGMTLEIQDVEFGSIVGGTSLVVYPAAGLIQYYEGNRLVVINKTELSAGADLTIYGAISEVLSQVKV